MSARKASRHIHHRFFLIADKAEKGYISVEHCGTKEMWADGNTKPLQGAGFRLFRPKVMGILENYDDEAEMVRTHPELLLKPKEAGVVSSADLKVLFKALGVKGGIMTDRRGRPHQRLPYHWGEGVCWIMKNLGLETGHTGR